MIVYGWTDWRTQECCGVFIDNEYSSDPRRSFYFAMVTMTTVGYGDISPTNTAELTSPVESGRLRLSVFVGHADESGPAGGVGGI